MTNHITLSDFPASCSCMKLTSKQGRPYWFRTCGSREYGKKKIPENPGFFLTVP